MSQRNGVAGHNGVAERGEQPRRGGGVVRARVRVERAGLRALTGLPPQWQARLAGMPPVPTDEGILDPTIRLILSLQRIRRLEGLTLATVHETRERMRMQTLLVAGAPTPVGAVRDLTVDGADGPLPARHYLPVSGERRPLLVFFHGGGFVAGDLDTHDEPCRLLCRHADVHVLSVAYRLAPEHPFPAGVQDASVALRWAQRYAGDLGANPDRVAVGGDSAGANLSTVACQLAARDGAPAPAAQLLLYPPTDHRSEWHSRAAFSEGLVLTAADIDWYHDQYIVSPADPYDPRHSPLCAPDLSGQPPAIVVTAAFDPLRDEGEAYADALRAAGTPVVSWRVPGMVHGFVNLTAVSRSAREAVIEVAGAMRAMLLRHDARSGGVVR